MPTTPHILITNDDGITSPGLLALKDALTEVACVTVLAPNHNWPASGHVKTTQAVARGRSDAIGWHPGPDYRRRSLGCRGAGVPAIAVSLNSHTCDDFGNVNVPPLPADQIGGVLVTRMGLRIYREARKKGREEERRRVCQREKNAPSPRMTCTVFN